MKGEHRAAWLMVCGLLLLTSCRDREKKDEQPAAQRQEEHLTIPLPQEEPSVPGGQEVRTRLLPLLADFAMVKLGELRMDTEVQDDGGVLVTGRAMLNVEENLYMAEEAPSVFNEQRKEINAAMNRAMLPESNYLLQAGANADEITDEDRAAKPLPEALQKQADEIKTLAESALYRMITPSQTGVEIPLSMRAVKQEGQWVFSEINFDTTPLRSLMALIPESNLPQGASVVTDGFEAKRRDEIRSRIEAFNAAALPYINGREQAARERVVQTQARQEEERKAAEQEAAERAVRREQWSKTCADFFYDAAVYEGEWKRADAFGKLSLRIARGQEFPDSLQFIGTLSDTDLPQAEVQVVGRCSAPAKEGDPVSCVVRIYNGRYDPDIATAEVFDAQDGLLRLIMTEEGMLNGEMTCESWSQRPEKVISVSLKLAPKKQPVRRRRAVAPVKPANSPPRQQPARQQASAPRQTQ